MTARKKIGSIFLIVGVVVLIFGIFEHNRSSHPNACIVDFSRSLGGKASLSLKNSTQQQRYYGMMAISAGVILTLAGGVLVFRTKK
jgi:drug/metabolite transporter (DMT)-like permease